MIYTILANRPPSAAFSSPFGGGRYKSCRTVKNALGQTDTHMGRTDRQTHIWDRQTDRHTWPMKNSFYARNFFVCGPIPGLGFFQTPRTHGESVNVIGFKIGPETEAVGPYGHTH